MPTLEQRLAATGRGVRSESRLPLAVQKREILQAAKTLVDTASEAYRKSLTKELRKLRKSR